jgi:VWFA-related protein
MMLLAKPVVRDRESMRYRVMLLGLVLPVLLAADQPEQALPRFRAGANLVRVDAYVSRDNVALTDLTAGDFLVYEDDKPQQVESFELIRARGPNPQSERTDPTSVRDMRQEMQDAARVFTLFFDRRFVSLSGSYHARQPIIQTLDRVIGPDDLVGAMTPEMSPTSVTYSRKTGTIESYLTQTWHWGERMRSPTTENTDAAIRGCRWAMEDTAIRRKYDEQQTLNALRSLVGYLDGLRPERKFVMIFTEGWPLYPADSRMGPANPPVVDGPGVDPRTGGLRRPEATDPDTNVRSDAACDRIRSMLSMSDHRREFLELLQAANRANVSFYPIDTRGLIVCDNPDCSSLAADSSSWNQRRNHLYDMASQTDGHAIIDAGDVGTTMRKVFADVGSYYLLGYYSTNQKLDGRFRRIRVEVKRPGTDVRARPGYLAPTEAEARAASSSMDKAVAARAAVPPTVSRALDTLAPTRGNLPVRMQAAGSRGTIRAIVELDAATVKSPEWLSGGTLRVTIEPEKSDAVQAATQTMTTAIEPGQRSVLVTANERPLAAGRYSVRAELTARTSRLPIQVTTVATVPAESSDVATAGLASRRGPSTGLVYVATADPRFRRSERLRLEVPLSGEGFTGVGRLLTRDGRATPLIVSYSERSDEATRQILGVADLTLAPLAEGEYVVELSLTKNGITEVVAYGFRMVP